ncbi:MULTISPECIES: hypothetical protein [unclassified Calothrix]|uniref:hypothetical protein n=1 Tax=unclassified Calothrix TaxID=2619626 RepID=UPI0016884729|nr:MULTISPECIES: hypothetical protein [unclassified Calothrix]MBD2202654.1 hypothetical protein [Calothrix sp. FACHB-168]
MSLTASLEYAGYTATGRSLFLLIFLLAKTQPLGSHLPVKCNTCYTNLHNGGSKAS